MCPTLLTSQTNAGANFTTWRLSSFITNATTLATVVGTICVSPEGCFSVSPSFTIDVGFGLQDFSLFLTRPTFNCLTRLQVVDRELPVFPACTAPLTKSILVDFSGNPVYSSDLIVFWTPPTASDNVRVTRVNSTALPGQTFALGLNNVSYQAWDSSNNTEFCNFTINLVGQPASEVLPGANPCPGQRTLPPDAQNQALYGINFNMVLDDGGPVNFSMIDVTSQVTRGAIVGPRNIMTMMTGGAFQFRFSQVLSGGTNEVALASTLKGSSISRVCTIRVFIADRLPPVITCPFNITANAAGNVTLVSYPKPAVDDNSGVIIDPVLVEGVRSGYEFGFGSTLIVFSATDPANNRANGSFSVHIIDKSPPVFQSCVGFTTAFAQNTFTNGRRLSVPLFWSRPIVYDSLDPNPTVTYSLPLGSQLPLGEARVNVTATDAAGNSVNCSFIITVKGTFYLIFTPC